MPEHDQTTDTVTAALLIIGEEILSGRTRDENISHIARYLNDIGIALREVRVVADLDAEIIAAVNALRARYDYVFTTGGIGPTHDDVTTEAIAAAFGVRAPIDPRAVEVMRQHYRGRELNEARLRMARIPEGAELIDNPISSAPGFMLDNVIVMAGIPNIMQVMLDAVAPRLRRGAPCKPDRCGSQRRKATWRRACSRSRPQTPRSRSAAIRSSRMASSAPMWCSAPSMRLFSPAALNALWTLIAREGFAARGDAAEAVT